MKRNAKIELTILGLAFAAGVALMLSGCTVRGGWPRFKHFNEWGPTPAPQFESTNSPTETTNPKTP